MLVNKILERVKEIKEYQDMINGLVRRELRGKYKASALGFLWNFVNPLMSIIVYIIVFSWVFNSGIEQYPIYLIVGMMPWNFFSTSLGGGSGAIVHQADMTKKIFFPREVLVISTVTANFINLLITYVIVLGIVFIWRPLSHPILLFNLVIALITEYMFALGLALIIAAIDVYFRDVEYMTGVILMAWVWMTPVMYAIEGVPQLLQNILQYNPMTWYVRLYQDVLYFNVQSSGILMLKCGIAGIVAMIVGEIIFLHLEGDFAEEL